MALAPRKISNYLSIIINREEHDNPFILLNTGDALDRIKHKDLIKKEKFDYHKGKFEAFVKKHRGMESIASMIHVLRSITSANSVYRESINMECEFMFNGKTKQDFHNIVMTKVILGSLTGTEPEYLVQKIRDAQLLKWIKLPDFNQVRYIYTNSYFYISYTQHMRICVYKHANSQRLYTTILDSYIIEYTDCFCKISIKSTK